ncbi:hypothetical protein IKD48_00740 [bacterium]|nr:hypothetical protein [bacterium]
MICSYYESFLRKDIFTKGTEYILDVILFVYDNEPEKRRYINGILEGYISGQLSSYEAFKFLKRNVYYWFKRVKENSDYLDEEYANKMKGDK